MIVENPKPISNEVKSKMEQYRMRLLDAGMLEPTKKVLPVGIGFFTNQQQH